MSILLIITIVILPALQDGLWYRGKKTLSKMVEVLFYFSLCWFTVVVYRDWWNIKYEILLACVFTRIAFYNITFNLIAGLDWHYLGSTDVFFDIPMSWILKKTKSDTKDALRWIYLVFEVVSVVTLIKYMI